LNDNLEFANTGSASTSNTISASQYDCGLQNAMQWYARVQYQIMHQNTFCQIQNNRYIDMVQKQYLKSNTVINSKIVFETSLLFQFNLLLSWVSKSSSIDKYELRGTVDISNFHPKLLDIHTIKSFSVLLPFILFDILRSNNTQTMMTLTVNNIDSVINNNIKTSLCSNMDDIILKFHNGIIKYHHNCSGNNTMIPLKHNDSDMTEIANNREYNKLIMECNVISLSMSLVKLCHLLCENNSQQSIDSKVIDIIAIIQRSILRSMKHNDKNSDVSNTLSPDFIEQRMNECEVFLSKYFPSEYFSYVQNVFRSTTLRLLIV
jgi:hypothetical protein